MGIRPFEDGEVTVGVLIVGFLPCCSKFKLYCGVDMKSDLTLTVFYCENLETI